MPVNTIVTCLIVFLLLGAIVYVTILLIRALRKFILSKEMRQEKKQIGRSLGEVLKKYRTDCRMTQEFVAETLGVSRQAVSKWESGASDPSTTNLLALAKLYCVSAEELLNGISRKGAEGEADQGE